MSDTETLPVAAPVIANELTVVLAPDRDSGVQLGAPDLPKSTRDTVYRVLQHGLTLFVLLCVALMGFLVVGTDLMHSRYQRQLLDTFRSADQLETLPPLTPNGAAPSTGPGANGTVNSTGGTGTAAASTTNAPVVTGTPIALLRIPRIHVSEVVAEGTNSAQTLRGPGHLPATPLPGQLGNAVVIGRHSTGGAPFGSLGSLKPGDHFSFVVYSGTVTYRVLSVRTYHASDMSIFGTQHAAGKNINTATLITSTSMFDSNRRLAVVGQLQGTPAGFTPGHIAPNDSDLGLALNHGGLVARVPRVAIAVTRVNRCRMAREALASPRRVDRGDTGSAVLHVARVRAVRAHPSVRALTFVSTSSARCIVGRGLFISTRFHDKRQPLGRAFGGTS